MNKQSSDNAQAVNTAERGKKSVWRKLLLLVLVAGLAAYSYSVYQKTAAMPDIAPEEQNAPVVAEVPAPPAPAPTPMPEVVAPAPTVQKVVEQVIDPSEKFAVRPQFIEYFAEWLATGYGPAGSNAKVSHSVIRRDLQMLNKDLGINMTGFTRRHDDLQLARSEFFAEVLYPSIVRAMYSFYVDDFMAHFDKVVQNYAYPRGNKPAAKLSKAEQKDLYGQYKYITRSLALSVDAILHDPRILQNVTAWQKASEATLQANAQFAEDLLTYQEAAAQSPLVDNLNALKTQSDASSKAFQQAIQARERAFLTLQSSLRLKSKAYRMRPSESLYVAQWIQRRLQASPKYKAGLESMNEMLFDMAKRFEAKYNTL